VSWQDIQPGNSCKHIKSPHCPFRNFYVFLNGEAPDAVLAEREYLRSRVDELEFSIDIANRQAMKLQARIRELLKNRLPLGSEVFLRAVKVLLKDAIFLYNQHTVLTPDKYRSGRKNMLKRFRKLLWQAPLSRYNADNIRKRLIKFKNELFVFLKYPAINPTNNWAETGINNSVLFRKITFGKLNPVKILKNLMTNGITSRLLKPFELPENMPQSP